MPDWLRWVLILVCAVLVVALIGYARGDKHHHGDDVGAIGVVQTARP